MRMSKLWNTVDQTIVDFVRDKTHRHILWKNDVLYSKKDGNKILCGSKTIVSVDSATAASELENRLRTDLSDLALLVKDPKTKEKRPFKLKIKTIQCPEQKSVHDFTLGYAFLRKSKIAVTKRKLSRDDIEDIIEEIFENQMAELYYQKAEYEKIDNESTKQFYLKTLDDAENKLRSNWLKSTKQVRDTLKLNEKYCISGYKPFARNYRITYNDITGQRKQTAVGDVLIVINGTRVLDDPRITQERSDTFAKKHTPLLYIGSAFEYHVFAEDKALK